MLYLGTVRAGGVFLPLNNAYTATEVAYFLDNAGPRIFVCDPARHAEFEALTAKLGVRLETMGVWTDPDTSAGSLPDAGVDACAGVHQRGAWSRTIWQPSSTRPAPPGAPRAPC